MDPVALAQHATDILIPALSALSVVGGYVAGKGTSVLEEML